MENWFHYNFKDCVAFSLLVLCLVLLIAFDGKISDSLRQTLGYVIVGCFGFLFRGNS